MELNLAPMDDAAWEVFALQAERFARGDRHAAGITEWAILKVSPTTLNHHKHFALAEIDDMMEHPDHAGFKRIVAVKSLFQAIGYADGVEAISSYLRVYQSKQRPR